ncbi:unnamed protein product [Hymenolepis diminuta]|uniref:Uncharacterized protein n=2 Tax=Hymenolepis diminuta TaxID=6216 RepID=A0A564ZBA4_HYMDI|nr:unnamed protein product [Hymenolepis diminuta]
MANSAHQLLGSAYHPMQNADMRGSPSNVSHVSALTQRILSEVYIAAAKAASMAVSESIASGSMDAMNQTGGGTGTYRPSSNYAESVSMIGGSISGIDGLGMYQVPTPNGITRMRKSPRTATPTYQSHFTAQSPVSSAATPYMARPRIASQTGSGLGWASPMLTPQATMRLNEAANALAAAAAAAVLEATGAAPNLNEVQGGGNGTVDSHRSRFNGSAGAGGGGTNGGLATSSEDGESVSSNSFFSRNPNGKPSSQEASSKLQRKKLAQDSHKGSFSNPLSDCLLPMLSVPNNISPNYLQTVDPRSVRTSSTELSTFLPSISLDGPWNHNFQPIRNPRPGEETKFNPYSESQSQAEMSSTFDKTPTPSARHPAPIITSQGPSSSGSFMTIDGNTTSENTLRENDIVSMNAKSQSQTEPPTSQTINPTHNESQK